MDPNQDSSKKFAGKFAGNLEELDTSIRPFHVERLQQELEFRKKRNPRYSLRAFAYFLGIDPASLSRILAGKQDLSLRATVKVTQALKLMGSDKERFVASVTNVFKNKAAVFLSDLCEKSTSLDSAESSGLSLVKEVVFLDPRRIPEACELIGTFARSLERIFGNCPQTEAVELHLRSRSEGLSSGIKSNPKFATDSHP